MYISNIPYLNQTSYKPRQTFTGQAKVTAPVAKQSNGLKRIFPWIIGAIGLCSWGGGYQMGNKATYSGVEDSLGIHTEYHNVSQEIKDSLMKPVYVLKSKLNKSNDFISGIQIDVAHSLKNITPKDDWQEYVKANESDNDFMGTSFYSDSKLKKRIAIQEISHRGYATIDKNSGKLTVLPAMRHTLMHETGHHFDNFFGHDHNSKLALQWDSVLYAKEKNPFTSPYDFEMNIKDEQIDSMNVLCNDLSDKTEYKKAFLKDFNNLKNIPKNKLPKDIEYYTSDFNIMKVMKESDLNEADYIRSEVYANLFAYAMGENDGNKEKFVKSFANCNRVVKKDIAKFLKIVVK